MNDSPHASSYDIEDVTKIQGRDEVLPENRDLAAIRLQRAMRAIREATGPVLLPGAGAGRYARAMARLRPDLHVVAGDLSIHAIAEAQEEGGAPLYLALDAEHLPFCDASFGAVVFFDLLEHVPHPMEMLSECARVLRPGGVLHFFVPLENEPGSLYHILRNDRPIPIHRWKHDHVGHIQRYRRAQVLAMVWNCGMEITTLDHSFHLVGQVHDIVDYWHRERASGGTGLLPTRAVDVVTRGVFLFTWRLSYLEDRVLHGSRWASGVHVTARKRA